MPAGNSQNSFSVASIIGAALLGVLAAAAFAHIASIALGEIRSAAGAAKFSPAAATVYAQRDLLLQEEALFDAERAGFEDSTRVAFRPLPSSTDLAIQLDQRARAGVILHEEALHAMHAPRLILIADLIQEFRAEYAPAAPGEDALAGGASLALAAPGGPVALFAPAAGSSAPSLRPRAPVAVSAATPACGLALQNYYSIRNGYAGRTVEKLSISNPLASARRSFFAPSSAGFPASLDFTTAHTLAPEFPV